MDWGPYSSQAEAQHCLWAFTNAVTDRRLGIIWSAGNDAISLRPPVLDNEGFGLSLLCRYDIVQAPKTSSFEDAIDRLDHFLGGMLTSMGQQQLQQSQMQMDASRAQLDFLKRNVVTPITEFIDRHETAKDVVAVALDVSAVIAGAAAFAGLLVGGSTMLVTIGLGLGVLAGVGALALLIEDARHLWFVLKDDKAGKAALENKPDYQWVQAVAPLIALPDLAMSGRSAMRELMEASEQSARAARMTAAAGRAADDEMRNFRQMFNDPEQSAKILGDARARAAARAARYQKLQQIAKGINRDLMLKANAAAAYGGTVYGTNLYTLEPPELVKKLFHGATPQPAPRTGANDPFRLLGPVNGNHAHAGHVQVTAVVSSRRSGNGQ